MSDSLMSNIKDGRFPKHCRMIKADAFASALSMKMSGRTESFGVQVKAFRVQYVVDAQGLDTHIIVCGSGNAQLGLIIPKRLAKHAVIRNRIKRLAREYFRQHAKSWPPGYWLLRLHRVVTHVPLSKKQNRIWYNEMASAFQNALVFVEQMQKPKSSANALSNLKGDG